MDDEAFKILEVTLPTNILQGIRLSSQGVYVKRKRGIEKERKKESERERYRDRQGKREIKSNTETAREERIRERAFLCDCLFVCLFK